MSRSAWAPVRAQVETAGWGAQLLAHQDADGRWAGGTFFPGDFSEQLWQEEGQPWTATAFALNDLREFGLHPASDAARRTVRLAGENARWEADGQLVWSGETEECINGRTLRDGVYFGIDMTTLVDRLLSEQQPDGGWNCERPNGSTRSSYHSTINVLEGLLAFERATEDAGRVSEARQRGEEFLLQRNLFRRLSTGEPADPAMLDLLHPVRWHYTVLRGLDYFRATGQAPDSRAAEAVEMVRSRRLPDGRWPLDSRPGGRVWFEVDDGPGMPSRWVTLQALRVLAWADG